MPSIRTAMAGLAWMAIVTACGSGNRSHLVGDGGVCGMITACGGDLTGSWTLESLCFDDIDTLVRNALGATDPACAGTVKSAGVTASGSYRFGSSSEVTLDVTYHIDVETVWTLSCLETTDKSPFSYLDEYCSALVTRLGSTRDFDFVHCELAGCACRLSGIEHHVMDKSDYRVHGTSLQQADIESPYCVQGDMLHILRKTGGATGTFVLRRK